MKDLIAQLEKAHEEGNVDGDLDGGNHFDVSPDPLPDCLTCMALDQLREYHTVADAAKDVLDHPGRGQYADTLRDALSRVQRP